MLNYEYIPLVNEDCVWSYCDVVKVGFDQYDLNYSQLKFKGDTIINEISYKKLFKRECILAGLFYIASMREENKKVYAIYSGKQQEKLIYNFSLVIVDSMLSLYDDSQYFQVTKIDTKDNIVNVGQLSNGFYIFRLSRNSEVSHIGKIIKNCEIA